ncbi:MAG: PorT family protein [Candidatus Aminicenantes bacterium]|nr:PorT family protein [Candidatus Aminicenantes bacterium]
MKKILIILSIFLFISGAYAQTGKFLGGLNLSNYHSTNETTSQKFGYWGGVGFEFGAGLFTGEFDILYFQKGATVAVNGRDVDFTLSELLLPAMIRIKFLPGTSPYIFGGGEIGYVLSYKSSDAAVPAGRDIVKSLDYGLIFGAGIEIWFGSAGIFIEGRYHLGMAPMGEGAGFDFKTNSIAFLLGFVFF